GIGTPYASSQSGHDLRRKIGRASCRERVEISAVAVSVKKKLPSRKRGLWSSASTPNTGAPKALVERIFLHAAASVVEFARRTQSWFGRCTSSGTLASTAAIISFFQAEDGIRDWSVTGVQTCALPI